MNDTLLKILILPPTIAMAVVNFIIVPAMVWHEERKIKQAKKAKIAVGGSAR